MRLALEKEIIEYVEKIKHTFKTVTVIENPTPQFLKFVEKNCLFGYWRDDDILFLYDYKFGQYDKIVGFNLWRIYENKGGDEK